MRNFNTSFFKNAICRFGNEAGQVLRVCSDPATCLLRLIRSFVRTLLEFMEPSYRLQPISPSGTSAISATLYASAARFLVTMFGETLEGQHGTGRWRCQASQAVS